MEAAFKTAPTPMPSRLPKHHLSCGQPHAGDPGTRRRGIKQCARQLADHLAGKRQRPGRWGRRGWGRKGRAGPRDRRRHTPGGMLRPEQHPRPQSLDARGPGVGSPQLSPGGLARAELACSQLSSNDGLLERSPRPAPPGRREDEPRLRASWNGAACDRRAPGNLGFLERDP